MLGQLKAEILVQGHWPLSSSRLCTASQLCPGAGPCPGLSSKNLEKGLDLPWACCGCSVVVLSWGWTSTQRRVRQNGQAQSPRFPGLLIPQKAGTGAPREEGVNHVGLNLPLGTFLVSQSLGFPMYKSRATITQELPGRSDRGCKVPLRVCPRARCSGLSLDDPFLERASFPTPQTATAPCSCASQQA